MTSSKGRVLLVAGSLPPMPCGVGAYTAQLLRSLDGRRAITVLQPSGTAPVASHPAEVTPGWGLRSLWKLRRILGRDGPTAVLLEYPTSGYRRSVCVHLFGPIIKWRRHRPSLVVSLHEHSASPLIGKVRNLAIVAFADRVTVSNALDLDALPSWIRRKTSIVPIGSNIDLVDDLASEGDSLAASVGLELDLPITVFFGHTFPSKRLERFIDVARSESSLRFLIITNLSRSNDYHLQILESIEAVNAEHPGRVVLAEGMDDRQVSLLLRRARYLVMPDDHPLTGKSGSCAAGLLHGLVVIGKAAPSTEMNLPYRHKENCYLLDSLARSSIATALRELEADEPLRQRIRRGAATTAATMEWGSIASQLLDIIEECGRRVLPSGSS